MGFEKVLKHLTEGNFFLLINVVFNTFYTLTLSTLSNALSSCCYIYRVAGFSSPTPLRTVLETNSRYIIEYRVGKYCCHVLTVNTIIYILLWFQDWINPCIQFYITHVILYMIVLWFTLYFFHRLLWLLEWHVISVFKL